MGQGSTSTYTLDEALVAIGFGKFQMYVLGYVGLAAISQAMETMIVSFIGQSVKFEWDLSSNQESLLSSVVFAGILIGAYSSGFISDNYGRRKGILSVGIVTSGAAFLSAFAPNYISMVILRCLVGVGLGGGTVYISWFLEFVPAPDRGIWMVIASVFWSIGNIFEASLAWMILPRLSWRWLLAVSSIPSFATLFLYNLVPESPRYLCLRGQTTDAHNMLQRAAILNQTELPQGVLINSDQMAVTFDEEEATCSSASIDSTLLSPKTVSKIGFSTLGILFSSSLYMTTFLLWVVFFGVNFAYFGIILLTSKLSISRGESEYCTSFILHSDNSKDDSSYIDILVASFAELPGIVCSAFIIDRVGRKVSMGIMFAMGFVSLLPLLLLKNEISMTISLFGARMFIAGGFSIANVYAPEVYPTSVRATGVALASAVGGIGGMVCPLVAVGLLNQCYQTTSIILFEFVIIVAALCAFLFPLETKGLELQDKAESVTLIF